MLIFAIVLGHLLEIFPTWGWQLPSLSHSVLSFFYTLHIPCLVFLSGFWFNPTKALFRTQRLLMYYLIFQTLYNFLIYTLYGAYEIKYVTYLAPYWLMWYVMALMLWNVIGFKIAHTPHKALWLAFSLLGGYAIAFLPHAEHHFYLSIGRVMVFLPLFLLGMFYGKSALAQIDKLPTAAPYVALLLIFIVLHLFPQHQTWLFGRANAHARGETLAGVLMIQSALWTLSCIGIAALIKLRHTLWRGFTTWGKTSFAIYLTHGFVINTISAYYSDHDFPTADPIISLLIAIVLAVGLCVVGGVFNRWIRL